MSLDPAFQGDARTAALEMLTDILGTEQAKAAATRIALALNVLGKRNRDVYQADPQSIGECIAACALSGLAVGGAMPTCYVLPRKRRIPPTDGSDKWVEVIELNWTLGFRGMVALAQRAGFQVQAFPVYPERVPTFDSAGRFIIPTKRLPPVDRAIENLIGVLVKVRRMSDGLDYGDTFVEVDQIEDRRAKSDAWQRGQEPNHFDGWGRNKKERPKTAEEVARSQSSPWYEWPEEMALKTAIRYACSRGMVPLDDAGQRALEYDGKRDNVVIDVPSESVSQTVATPARGRAALGMDTSPPVHDFAAEAERLRKRDAIPVASEQAAPEQQAKQEPAAPTKAAKPKVDGIPNKGQLLTRLAAIGITLDMAVAHVATPDAAWGADELRALKQLGIDVAEGRVTLESLAVNDDPLAESGGGEEP
jgi:recombinational DNA repair protein RecT